MTPGISRTVFITGCSSGIGLATALLLSRAGHRVTATARRVAALTELEATARNEQLSLCTMPCDVSDEMSITAAIEFAHSRWGPIHVLVNNAGYGLMGPLEGIPLDKARAQLETNTLGPVRLIQQVLPDMRAAGWGRIINVSSIAGRIAIPYGGWYSASKFALEALNDCLRIELEQFGIRTSSIMPGPVRTAFTRNLHVPGGETVAGLYRPYLDLVEARRTGQRRFEITPELVGKVILHAIRSSRPRARYYLTVSGRAGACLSRFLPDFAMDAVLRRFYGISRIERRLKRGVTA